jgi:DNA-binding transcriptional MocR family regulator
MQNKGVQASQEDLIVTAGSQQALDLIGKCMISPGDKVIVEAPTFLATIQCFRLYGADVVGAPIDEHGVDVDALEALIVAHRPKMIYLIPSFGNPSGALLSLERRKRILALAVQHRVLVVEDDPYGDLYFDQSPDALPPLSMLALSAQVQGSRDWLAYTGSLSKVMSPGLRIGWLVAPAGLLTKANMCKQFSDAHTSNLSQAIAANYLNSGRMPRAMDRVRLVYGQRAKALGDGLKQAFGDAIAFTQPKGGMFIWARLTGANGQPKDAAAWAKRAIDSNVAFVPGAPFYAHDPDPTTLRLSFASVDEDKIAQGVQRLLHSF